MKRILLITLLIAAIQSVSARTFEIILLNTPTIEVDGKSLKVGDKFGEEAEINWVSEKQAMKVLSDDRKVYVLSPKLWDKYKVKNFSDYLVTVKTAAVRNGGENFPVTTADHKMIFEGDFVMMDSVVVNVGWRVDDVCYFEGVSNNAGERNFTFVMPSEEGRIVIGRELVEKLAGDADMIVLTVKYIENDVGETTLITDEMTIYIMPKMVEIEAD